MVKKQKSIRNRVSSTLSSRQGAFGSGQEKWQFKVSKKVYLLAPVLIIGVGVYAAVTSQYFGFFDHSRDEDKGLIHANQVEEATVPLPAEPAREGEKPTLLATGAEASVEGESTDPPVEDNKMAEGEESSVERAAIVDTEMDNHEVEALGGGN